MEISQRISRGGQVLLGAILIIALPLLIVFKVFPLMDMGVSTWYGVVVLYPVALIGGWVAFMCASILLGIPVAAIYHAYSYIVSDDEEEQETEEEEVQEEVVETIFKRVGKFLQFMPNGQNYGIRISEINSVVAYKRSEWSATVYDLHINGSRIRTGFKHLRDAEDSVELVLKIASGLSKKASLKAEVGSGESYVDDDCEV